MPKYYEDTFYYDSVKIRSVNKLCHRYANRHLWDNDETTEYDGKTVIEDNPPISTYDIALLQVALSQEVDYASTSEPIVASFSVDWKSDRGDFVHHVVRFDMLGHNVDMSRLTEQARTEWNVKAEKMRNVIDLSFDRIASTYTTHHLGWFNAPLETTLYGIPEELQHGSTQIKLPDGYGTLFLTIVSSVDTDDNGMGGFTIEEVMDNIRGHFDAFEPQKRK